MRRRLVMFFPLALLLAILALWIISSYRYFRISLGTSQRVIELAFNHGRFRLLHKSMPDPRVNPWRSRLGPPLEWPPGLTAATESLDADDFFWNRPLMGVAGTFGWRQSNFAGIRLCRGTISEDNSRDTEDAFIYPFWFVESPLAWPAALMALAVPFPLLAWRRHRRRSRQGLCPTCAYDLRAHAPGDKCPECGTLIPQTLQRASRSTE